MVVKSGIFIPILLAVLWRKSNGQDIFEGVFQGAPCFKPRNITGCSGTLMANFKPTAQVIASNKPDTLVFLFTNRNPDEPEYLQDCGGTLPTNTYFDFAVPTEVIVHGYFDGTCRTAWMREMKDQLMERGNYNVILVDWTWGNFPDLTTAGINTQVVGQQLSFVLTNIVNLGADIKKIHIIGHSYGVYVASFAGKRIKGLGRLTGLDPAFIGFGQNPPEKRLSRSDAELVDVIHTSGTSCAPLGGGEIFPWAHADFYPNGGRINPSCLTQILPYFLKGSVFYGLLSFIPQVCSHLQAIQFYKVSINPGKCEFIGHECSSYLRFKTGECNTSCGGNNYSCAVMGMDFAKSGFTKNGTDGIRKYYLETGLKCPYCIQDRSHG